MRIIYSTVLCFMIVVTGLADARECGEGERDKAASFADKAGEKIMRSFPLGGRDLRIGLSSCDYNTFTKRFKMGIDIEWNGAMNRDNYYNISGELRTNEDSSNTEFSQTYANDNVKDMAFWRGFGFVIALGVLIAAEAEAKKNQEQAAMVKQQRQEELQRQEEQRRQQQAEEQQRQEQQRRQQQAEEQQRQEQQRRQEAAAAEQQRQEEEQQQHLAMLQAAEEKASTFVDQLPHDPLMIITGAGVMLRQAPRENANKGDMLQIGTIVSQLEEKTRSGENWYQVRTPTGEKGWVSGQFVMELDRDEIGESYIQIAQQKLNSSPNFGELVDLCNFLSHASDKVEYEAAKELKRLYLVALQKSLDKIPSSKEDEPRYSKWIRAHEDEIRKNESTGEWEVQ